MTVKELRDRLGELVAAGHGGLPVVFELTDAMGDGETVNFAVKATHLRPHGEKCIALSE